MVTFAEASRLPIPKWVEYHQLLDQDEILKQESIFKGDSHEWIIQLYKEYEKGNIKYISFLGAEIGLMARLKEKFKSDQKIQAYCHYFINLHTCEIEELYNEIEQYREFAKGFKELSG